MSNLKLSPGKVKIIRNGTKLVVRVLEGLVGDPDEWVMGSLPDPDELAGVLSKNEYASDIFEEGVLIVAQAYQAPLVGASGTKDKILRRLTIEGIGDTPERAASNFLTGENQDELQELIQKMNLNSSKLLSEFNLLMSEGWERYEASDLGFFMKKTESGWRLEGNTEGLKMKTLRRAAEGQYLSRVRLASRVYEDELVRAVKTQEIYRQLLANYNSALIEAGFEVLYQEALKAREDAIANLEKARVAYEKAAKWQKVAQGMKMMSALTSLGAQTAGMFSSSPSSMNSGQSFIDQLMSFATKNKNTSFNLLQKETESVQGTSKSINLWLQTVAPREPLPNPFYRKP